MLGELIKLKDTSIAISELMVKQQVVQCLVVY